MIHAMQICFTAALIEPTFAIRKKCGYRMGHFCNFTTKPTYKTIKPTFAKRKTYPLYGYKKEATHISGFRGLDFGSDRKSTESKKLPTTHKLPTKYPHEG